MHLIDRLDARLISALDLLPGATVVALSGRLGVSRNTVQARLRRLENDGVLGPVSARIRGESLGLPLLGFITLAIEQKAIRKTFTAIEAIPEVTEMHTITGDGDLLVRIVARDTADFHRVTQLLQAAPGVVRSRSTIATTEVIPYRTRPLLERMIRAE